MLYTPKVFKYYERVGEKYLLWNDIKNVITVKAGEISAAEQVIFQIKLSADEKIKDCRFQVLGCGYMIAMVSWFAESISNKFVIDLENYDMALLIEEFSLPETKYHSALCLLEIIEKLQAHAS